jgi:hypothetical protein
VRARTTLETIGWRLVAVRPPQGTGSPSVVSWSTANGRQREVQR